MARKELSKNSQGSNVSNPTVKKFSNDTGVNRDLVAETKRVNINGEILEVKPNIDYDHIVGGDVKIKNITEIEDKNGVYKAEIEILNKKTGEWKVKKAETTMFPRDWSEQRIIEEINSAWNSQEFEITVDENGKGWTGTSKSGIEIKGYINPNGITAYPIYEGGK